MTLHEMDAVRCKEWKLMKFICDINDELAYRIFNIFHLPLYLVYILVVLTAADTYLYNFFIGFNIFLIFHAILHYYFKRYPHNTFNSFSYAIIYGMACCAVAELFWVYFYEK